MAFGISIIAFTLQLVREKDPFTGWVELAASDSPESINEGQNLKPARNVQQVRLLFRLYSAV